MSKTLTIGVLALQGSFSEHVDLLKSLQPQFPNHILQIQEVRTTVHLGLVSALIIPGGESTTMSLIASRTGLFELLKEFISDAKKGKKVVWGTCAGMILLGEEVVGGKEGAEGFGGMDVKVVRNQWGRQSESFEYNVPIPCLSSPEIPFRAIFIRAPVLFSLLSPSASSPPLEVLARVPRSILPVPKVGNLLGTNGNMNCASELGPDADVVMARQGGLIISSFHPELTVDKRIHQYFIEQVVKL